MAIEHILLMALIAGMAPDTCLSQTRAISVMSESHDHYTTRVLAAEESDFLKGNIVLPLQILRANRVG